MARHRHPNTVGLPFNAWPEVDRTAWLEAIREGDILSEAGRAAHWRPKTRRTVQKAYGNFLRFLAESDALDPSAPIAARLSEQHLRDYIAKLRRRTAPRTVGTQLRSLSQAFAALAPQADRQLLLHAIARLNRRASPEKSRTAPLPSPVSLIELGYQLMASWHARVAHDPRLNAMDYRDGLMIAFLALCPLRLENLASIRIGHQLRIGSAGARVVIDGADTKNGRPIDVEFPADLMSALKTYLKEPLNSASMRQN